VARILIWEPNPEVRTLLGHVVKRLGHEPVEGDEEPGGVLPGDIDVLVVDPAHPRALSAAQVLRLRDGGLPIVCASVYPATADADALRPEAYLVKPFPLSELEDALTGALARQSLAV
jgi:CheY-like chemotaxis protein